VNDIMDIKTKTRAFVALAGTALLVGGCLSPAPNYTLRTRTQELGAADLSSADYFREKLPEALGVEPSSLRIEPGPGATVVLYVGSETNIEGDEVLATIARLNTDRAFAPAMAVVEPESLMK
jgi:hypothetical protein